MADLRGVAVNFGFGGTDGMVMSGTGIGTFILQSAELSKDADVAEIRDGDGDVASLTFYNYTDSATLEYVVRGSDLAGAITQSTIPAPGAIVTITTCANLTSLVATSWIVQPGVKISGSNTDAKKVSLPLKKYTNAMAAVS